MQVETSYSSYTTNPTIQNNQQNIDSKVEETQTKIDTPNEPKTLKNMSLDEIKNYLETSSIEDETGSRANDLLDMQKFANKVDTSTYTQMTNAVLKEESSSAASMRYNSFPSEQMLDENPEMFNSMLDTTLAMETASALIFNLDFKKDFSQFQEESKDVNPLLTDFSELTLLAFMEKKMEDLEKGLTNGSSLGEENRIKAYQNLLGNYSKYKEEEQTSLDIVV